MWSNFKYRSRNAEMMDSPNIQRELLHQNLHELDLLNRTTGAHTITLTGMKQLITDRKKQYHIVDLGCGSGDALIRIAIWARKHDYKIRLTGVDINADVIDYLNNHCRDYHEIKGVVSDWKDYLNGDHAIDIIHCSLFCHHLHEDELTTLFGLLKHIKTGFVINDLQRNPLAYYSAYFLTRMLNGSVLSKNDGPISVLRGFKFNELIGYIRDAKINRYSVKRKWGFRYLVIGNTGK